MARGATRTTADAAPGVDVARTFVAAVVEQDFARLRGTVVPEVHLRALLPGGLREWTGAGPVVHRFARWFGDTRRFEPIERGSGELGGRIHLRWRVRMHADRLGPGPFVVEQVAFGDLEGGRIARLDLLCTGYLQEADGG